MAQEGSLTKKQWGKLQQTIAEYEHMVFIPSGLLCTRDYQLYADHDVPFEYARRKPKPPMVDSFFIAKHEVTNWEYLEYIYWLRRDTVLTWKLDGKKRVLSAVKNTWISSENPLPDSLGWRHPKMYLEHMVEYYFRHPAYRYHPVVNVSYAQAKEFCRWKTEQYNSNPYRTFEEVVFRLPTKNEWQLAALDGRQEVYTPLENDYHLNEKGELLANIQYFNQFGMVSDTIKYAGTRFDVDSTRKFEAEIYAGHDAPGFPRLPYAIDKGMKQPGKEGTLFDTRVLVPSTYGLYHLAGNAEEMVEEMGVTLGGSWRDMGYFSLITAEQHYPDENYSSPEMGFRVVMEVIKANPKLKRKKQRMTE